MTFKELYAENERRRKALFAEYDPVRGIGSLVPRFELPYDKDTSIWLPEWTQGNSVIPDVLESGSLEAWSSDNRIPFDAAKRQLRAWRVRHDFEYWAATCAVIKDKRTAQDIRFVFNMPQRMLAARLEAQRVKNVPVRIVVLKHRQWGCTTFSYTYINWHQVELYTNRDAWFIGLDKDGAEDVIQRYTKILKKYPLRKGLSLRSYGKGSARVINGRGSVINVGTVNEPNAPSGRTPHFAHLFEVGKWPSNPRINAENLVQNVESMVHDYVGTVLIMESTAKADTGTYFKKLCEKAEKGETAYEFFFVGWLTDKELVREVKGDVEKWVGRWEEYDQFLWDSGATFEQIAWYQNQKRKPGYVTKPHAIKEEFPTNSKEAFQTGAKRVFPITYVDRLRKHAMEPVFVGELYGDANVGKKSLKGIRFEEEDQGRLAIWRKPDDDREGQVSPDMRYVNRYYVSMDVGGNYEKADNNVLKVLDTFPVLQGDLPEIVAEWAGLIDSDSFAWLAARLATWYDYAELIPESNKWEASPIVDDENMLAPDETQTILDILAKAYSRLYMRQVFDEKTQKFTSKIGMHMNEKSKAMCVSALTAQMRQLMEGTGGYYERSDAACEEMDYYLHVRKRSGPGTVMAAAAGHKDDRVIASAILMWRYESAPPPKAIPKKDSRSTRRRPASYIRF